MSALGQAEHDLEGNGHVWERAQGILLENISALWNLERELFFVVVTHFKIEKGARVAPSTNGHKPTYLRYLL